MEQADIKKPSKHLKVGKTFAAIAPPYRSAHHRFLMGPIVEKKHKGVQGLDWKANVYSFHNSKDDIKPFVEEPWQPPTWHKPKLTYMGPARSDAKPMAVGKSDRRPG